MATLSKELPVASSWSGRKVGDTENAREPMAASSQMEKKLPSLYGFFFLQGWEHSSKGRLKYQIKLVACAHQIYVLTYMFRIVDFGAIYAQ